MSEAFIWKQKICQSAQDAMNAAAAAVPIDAEPAWLAADRILAGLGRRYPSVALPAEFGTVLAADATIGLRLPRELWMIISAYTVNYTDAAAVGLEKAVVARAYCLTVGNGAEADASRLRRAVLPLNVYYLDTIEDVMLRLFHTQRYDRAERVGTDLLAFLRPANGKPVWQRSINAIRLNMALIAAFRGDSAAAERLAVAADQTYTPFYDEERKMLIPSWLSEEGRLWSILANAWIAALMNDRQQAYFCAVYLRSAIVTVENFGSFSSVVLPRIRAFSVGLYGYLSNRSDGQVLTDVHNAVVNRLRTDRRAFPNQYPKNIFPRSYANALPKPK